MKKLFSTKYSAGAFNAAMLLLRLGLGAMMLVHGYDKLVDFSAQSTKDMYNVFGIGIKTGLVLTIFAEFFCSIFLILGLFTRLATIPLIICMSVIVFKMGHGDIFDNAQTAALFLLGYIVLLLTGPGKVSVDSMIGK